MTRRASRFLAFFVVLAATGCTSAATSSGTDGGPEDSGSGSSDVAVDVAPDVAADVAADAGGGADAVDDTPPSQDDGGPSEDAPSEALASEASPGSDCAPCDATMVSCIDVGPGLTATYAMMKLPDGTCQIAAMMLSCGGTGTAANGAALSWAVSNNTLVIQSGMVLLNCTPP